MTMAYVVLTTPPTVTTTTTTTTTYLPPRFSDADGNVEQTQQAQRTSERLLFAFF